VVLWAVHHGSLFIKVSPSFSSTKQDFNDTNDILAFYAALSAFSILLLVPELLPSPVQYNLLVLERAPEVLDQLDFSNKIGYACSKHVWLLLSAIQNTGKSLLYDFFYYSISCSDDFPDTCYVCLRQFSP
jgi:hypothetical protein